jgi:hypothetical protein
LTKHLTPTIPTPSKTVPIHRYQPAVINGEQINPASRKQILVALQEGNQEPVCRDALEQSLSPATEEPTMTQQPIVIIACKVFQGTIEKHIPETLFAQLTFLDYGLHAIPKKLACAIQEAIDKITEPSLIVFGYGLCGNGLSDIQAGKHILLVPKADDCITIFLGSRDKYLDEFNQKPGTYYLTKGWLESGSNPLEEYEQTVEKYGRKIADWVIDQQYQHYKRLAFVAHSRDDLEKYRPRALEVADFCQRWGMVYEEILGEERLIEKLIAVTLDLENADAEFAVIPPGGTLKQEDFR